jgi:hypothetical protein
VAADSTTEGQLAFAMGYPVNPPEALLAAGRIDLGQDEREVLDTLSDAFHGFGERVCSIGRVHFFDPQHPDRYGQHKCDALGGRGGGPIFHEAGQLLGLHVGGEGTFQQTDNPNMRWNLFYPAVQNEPLKAALAKYFGPASDVSATAK